MLFCLLRLTFPTSPLFITAIKSQKFTRLVQFQEVCHRVCPILILIMGLIYNFTLKHVQAVALNLFQGLTIIRFRNKFGMTLCLHLEHIRCKHIYKSLFLYSKTFTLLQVFINFIKIYIFGIIG